MLLLLSRLRIECMRQDEYEIHYKDRLVGVQRLDIFVAGQVVVELKVAEQIDPIQLAQSLSYVKTVHKEVGSLLRFGGPQPEFARRVLTPQAWRGVLSSPSTDHQNRPDLLFPELTAKSSAG